MRISDRFKAAQQAAFQDKSIMHRARTESTGSLGSVTAIPGLKLATYTVNLQIVQDAVQAAEWGLRVGKDAFMTSSTEMSIEIGTFVQHDGTVYQVQAALKRDSHWRWVLSATDEEAIADEG